MAGLADTIIGNLLQGTGYGKTPADYTQQQQTIQGNDQALQMGKLQLAAAQQQQQQQQQYSQDVSNWTAQGSPPDGLYKLALKYPQQAKSIVDANKMKDDAQQQADFHWGAQVYSAANSNSPDIVKQQLQDRRDAEAKAGIPTDDLDAMIQHFNTDPAAAMAQAKSTALAVMYGNNPDKFFDAFGIGKDKDYTLTPGSKRFNSDNQVVASVDEKPTYQKVDVLDNNGVKVGEKIVEVGGGNSGTSAPASPAAAGTPRSVRNNNPGNIEDGQFAQSQPGYTGSDGRFAQFDTPQSGAAAQTALLSQYGQQGRNTVAKIVSRWAPASDGNNVGAYAKFVAQKMGVHPNQTLDMTDPATLSGLQSAMAQFEGGSQSASNGATASASGGANVGGGANVRTVYDGTPPPQSPSGGLTGDDYLSTLPATQAAQVKALADGRMQFPTGFALKSPYWQNMLSSVAQYDPSFDAVNYNARAKTRADFTSGKSAQNIKSLNTAIGHLGTLAGQISGTWSTFSPLFNSVANFGQRATGGAGATNYAQTAGALSSELTTVFRGTGGAEADVQRYLGELSPDASQEQKTAAIKNIADLLQSRLEAVGDQYKQGMGKTIDPLTLLNPKAEAFMRRLGQTGDNPVAASQGSPIPPGAVYLGTSQGRPIYRVNGRNWTP